MTNAKTITAMKPTKPAASISPTVAGPPALVLKIPRLSLKSERQIEQVKAGKQRKSAPAVHLTDASQTLPRSWLGNRKSLNGFEMTASRPNFLAVSSGDMTPPPQLSPSFSVRRRAPTFHISPAGPKGACVGHKWEPDSFRDITYIRRKIGIAAEESPEVSPTSPPFDETSPQSSSSMSPPDDFYDKPRQRLQQQGQSSRRACGSAGAAAGGGSPISSSRSKSLPPTKFARRPTVNGKRTSNVSELRMALVGYRMLP